MVGFKSLDQPRRWDNGLDKPFADLTRMPNFYMTEKESYEITVALLGFWITFLQQVFAIS